MLSPQDIVEHAVKHKMPVAALTDVHTLSALPDFLLACKSHGIHGIAGLTVQIVDNNRPVGDLVLLAKGGKGFSALRKLLDKVGHLGDNKQFTPTQGLSLDELLSGKYAPLFKWCVMLDGFPGSIGEALAKQDTAQYDVSQVKAQFNDPQSRLSKLRMQFDDGDYLGVQTPQAKSPLAGALALPPTMVNGVDAQERRRIFESTMAVAKNVTQLAQTKQWFKVYAHDYLSTLGDESRINQLVNAKFNQQSLDVIEGYTPSHPPFQEAAYLKKRCKTPYIYKEEMRSDLIHGGPEMPSLEKCVAQAWARHSSRIPKSEQQVYRERLRGELDEIKKCGFEDYFVNVFKIQEVAKGEGNDLMLRGSAVASLVMHVMGLSPVDPVKEGLLFRRFLDSARIEEPDVDIEFVNPTKITRDLEAKLDSGQLAYLSSDEGISQLMPLLTLARNAMVNFYGLNEAEITALNESFFYLSKEIMLTRLNKEADKAWAEKGKPQGGRDIVDDQVAFQRLLALTEKDAVFGPKFDDWVEKTWTKVEKTALPFQKRLVSLAQAYNKLGLSSGLSPGSVVIIPEGVGRYFNLLQAKKDIRIDGSIPRIAQTKYNILSTGNIKYDLLSNKSFMRAMNAYETLGLDKTAPIAMDDPAVQQVFQCGAFLGVNQVSGYVGGEIAEQLRPQNFQELTAVAALIRDGVKKGPQFLAAREQQMHLNMPSQLQEFLSESYGLLIYEEQFMNILTEVAGFSWEEADSFRSELKKARGDKDPVGKYEPLFVQRVMAKQGIDEQTARLWYSPIREKRGKYVFNKAHAAAYAHVGVRQCKLKVEYPAQYAAEIFLDKNVDFRDQKDIGLSVVLSDWARLYPQGVNSPENAKDFIVAVGKVLLREEKNIDSTYDRNLDTIQSRINKSLTSGHFQQLLQTPDVELPILQKACENMFSRLREREYNPVSPEKIGGSGGGSGARKKTVTIDSHGNEIVKEVLGGGDVEPTALPVNRRKDKKKQDAWIDLDRTKSKVLIVDLLIFLEKEGVISNLITTPQYESGLMVCNYQYKDKKTGEFKNSEVKGRVREGEYPISSGFYQRTNRNKEGTSTLDLLGEIATTVGIPGVPEAPMTKGGKGELRLDYGRSPKSKERKIANKFLAAFKRFAFKSEHPLHDTASSGRHTSMVPAQTTPPPLTDVPPKQLAGAVKRAQELFEGTRGISFAGLAPQFEQGHVSYAQTIKGAINKDGGRDFPTEILANYRKVDSKTPLYALPNIVNHELASGGHQRFFFDREKQRANKMDMGASTKRIRGHIHGQVSQGMNTLWLTEAALDTWSFNELQREIQQYNQRTGNQVPFAEENSVSVKNAGGAVDTIEALLDVKIMKKLTDIDKGIVEIDFRESVTTEALEPFSERDQSSVSDWFKNNTIHWLDEGTPESTEAAEMMKAVMRAAGLTDEDIQRCVKYYPQDHNKSINDNVYAVSRHMKGENQQFLHRTNVKAWLRGSSFRVEKQPDGGYVAGGIVRTTTNGPLFSEMTAPEQQALKAKLTAQFKQLSGAQSLGLALDGDLNKQGQIGAGLIDALQVKDFCLQVGIPVLELMPVPKEALTLPHGPNGEPVKLSRKDHNDYLMMYKHFQQRGDQGNADKALMAYAQNLTAPQYAPAPKVAQAQASSVEHKPK